MCHSDGERETPATEVNRGAGDEKNFFLLSYPPPPSEPSSVRFFAHARPVLRSNPDSGREGGGGGGGRSLD